MKTRRAVWLTLVVVVNAILGTLAQGKTNSCISATDGFWDEARLWSLGKAPSIKQSAILITNNASETVTIDSVTATSFTSTLTVTNLSINPSPGSTDTLYLDNTGTIALHIIDGLNIGIITLQSAAGGSVLLSTNSTLIVDGLLGGQLNDDGTVVIAGGSLITTNCSLQVAPPYPTFFPSVGLLIISNGVVQARDVTLGTGTISGSSGRLEVIGGTMTLSSSLGLGAGDGGGGGGRGSLLVTNGGLFTVNGFTAVESGSITIANASFLGGGISLGGDKSGGELLINNGTVTLRGGMNIATGDLSDGSVSLNGGMLVVTNDIINIGGMAASGNFTVSAGIFLGQTMLLQGRLLIQGGTSVLSSNLYLPFQAMLNISGGQLFVTNTPLIVNSGLQCTISNGLLAANYIDLGSGAFSINDGSLTASTGITLENCGVCQIFLSGGQLIATNATHTGFIDVRGGQLVFSGGVLQVDKLVMTNSCSQFIHTGGTLMVGSVVLDPNAFAITSVAREGNDLRVTWLMGPGQTNALQVSSGGSFGGYATNGFTDIFVVTNNTAAGTITNYLDVGAATNKPARYYRARLAL